MLKIIIEKHINNYRKSYILLSIIFVFGIALGVLIINKSCEIDYIQKYFFCYIKNFEYWNITDIIFKEVLNKSKFILFLMILACTVILEKIIYIGVFYKGFSIGYSISAILRTYGIRKGILFAITTLGIPNVIFILCILFFANYCIIFCKFMKNNGVDIKRCYFKLFLVFLIIMIISAISNGFLSIFSYKILKKIQIFY